MEELARRVEERLKEMETYQATVVISYQSGGREASRFEIAVIARPREGKYRWEYRTPLKGHLVVSNGVSSWYYDADKDTVIQGEASPYPMMEWFRALFHTPEGFVRSLEGEEQVAGRVAYVVKLRSRNGEPTDLKIPVGTGTFISNDVLEVTYWIDREELFPLRLEERGDEGFVTLTEYRDLLLYVETPQHLFQRPEGRTPEEVERDKPYIFTIKFTGNIGPDCRGGAQVGTFYFGSPERFDEEEIRSIAQGSGIYRIDCFFRAENEGAIAFYSKQGPRYTVIAHEKLGPFRAGERWTFSLGQWLPETLEPQSPAVILPEGVSYRVVWQEDRGPGEGLTRCSGMARTYRIILIDFRSEDRGGGRVSSDLPLDDVELAEIALGTADYHRDCVYSSDTTFKIEFYSTGETTKLLARQELKFTQGEQFRFSLREWLRAQGVTVYQ